MKAASLRGDLLTRNGMGASRADAPVGPRPAAVAPGPAGEQLGGVRVSLRLDPHRHRRLELLSARNRTSLQETLIAAPNAYLDGEGRSVNSGNRDWLPESRGAPRNGDRPPRPATESER